jgi:predicted MPP superfamily phosphohydrolase
MKWHGRLARVFSAEYGRIISSLENTHGRDARATLMLRENFEALLPGWARRHILLLRLYAYGITIPQYCFEEKVFGFELDPTHSRETGGKLTMIRIAHVSDLHLHEEESKNVGVEILLSRIQTELFTNPADHNYLLVTGDVTDDGSNPQYQVAQTMLKRFAGKLLMVPGNHDYGPCGVSYSAGSAQSFDGLLHNLKISHPYIGKSPAVDHLSDGSGTELLTIGLNSNLQTATLVDTARGEIGNEQLRALDSILKGASPTAHKMVYLHHRPLGFSGLFLALNDAEDMMAILDQYRVDVVAFGHTGSHMRDNETPLCRIVRFFTRKFGAEQFSNANACVEAQRYNRIVFDGAKVTVDTV